jgi:hypothetical protein
MRTRAHMVLGLLLLIATAGLLPATALAVVPVSGTTPTLSPVTINDSAGDQSDPHVSGDWAAYTDDITIRYYNFASGVDAQIPLGPSVRDLLSDVSGSRIVFSRIILGAKAAIMVFDAASGAPPVEIDPAAGTMRLGSAIGGDTVAYVDYGFDARGELVLHDLASHTSVQVPGDSRVPSPFPSLGAKWIWAPGVTGSSAPAELAQFTFSKSVNVGGTPTAGTLHLAADDYAEVSVNGTLVGTTGSTTDVVVARLAADTLKSFDILPYLTSGVNTITVRGWNGVGAFDSCTNCTYQQNPAGFLVAFSISQIGVTSFYGSDESWSVFAGTTPLGASQYVCLSADIPPTCPAGATLYGYPGGGWLAGLSAADQNPAVSPDGQTVVWEHCATSSTNCDIWQARRSGASWDVSVVSSSASAEWNPDTNGTLVVYDSLRAGNSDVFWRPVAGGVEAQLQLSGYEANPSIAGDFIAFESRPTLFDTSDLFVYDLVRNRLFQVTDTPLVNEQLNDIAVLPDGRIRLVWANDEDGFDQRNIKGATFRLARSAPDQITDLIALIESFNLRAGLENSFDVKLRGVQEALAAANAGDVTTACNKLDAFLNEVAAQSGKALTASEAGQLAAAATEIKAALGCS